MGIALFRIVGITALVASSALAAKAQEAGATTTSTAATATTPGGFSEAQLEQLVAPIALYPDSLVAQILMASTYPLEIVQAARWLEKNPKLEGDALLEALKDQDWDNNVKALCGFPSVLTRMNENLDWTRDLGDAFLSQRAELMDAVQRMRGIAYDAGNLKTTEQQVITRQPDKIIVIESASPEVVYVPTYSPTVVYAGWSYPYWYYPPFYGAYYPYGGFLAFGAGVAWGAWLSGGCGWGWGSSDVDIDIDRNTNFDRNANRDRVSQRDGASQRDRASQRGGDRAGGKGKFQHNPSHRGGVNYRDSKTAQQFGARGGSNRVTRDQARGFDGGAGRATSRPAGGAGGRQSAAATRGAGSGGLGSQRGAASGQRANRAGGNSSRNTAYSGSRNGGFDRASSNRGSMSRGGGGFSRGGGGGFRGGGGRGGGRRR